MAKILIFDLITWQDVISHFGQAELRLKPDVCICFKHFVQSDTADQMNTDRHVCL